MDSIFNSASNTSDFLNNNTFISKITFLIIVLIAFILLYNIGYWIITYIYAPNKSPYIFYGLIEANTNKIYQQQGKDSVPIYRSDNKYNGIEFTWSVWFYVDDPTINCGDSCLDRILFVKGSNGGTTDTGSSSSHYTNSNGPGVYLSSNPTSNSSNYTNSNSIQLDLKVLMDIYPYKTSTNDTKHKETITIEKIPIQKWVSLIIRSTSQNIVDIIINGSLIKRKKLQNIVKQNYSQINIGGTNSFDGFLSNLKYYNYSIGTFEVDNIVNAGPNLTPVDDSNLNKANPYYLSTKWLFSGINL